MFRSTSGHFQPEATATLSYMFNSTNALIGNAPDLVDGIGRVRNKLAQEDLLVGVLHEAAAASGSGR
eukprot:363938-Chlamydomonas_euryale.AAC.10